MNADDKQFSLSHDGGEALLIVIEPILKDTPDIVKSFIGDSNASEHTIRKNLSKMILDVVIKEFHYLSDIYEDNVIDAYMIYTTILADKTLNKVFGKNIPKFTYVRPLDVRSTVELLTDRKFTRGFIQGIEDYINMTEGMLVNSGISEILEMAEKFGSIDRNETTARGLISQTKSDFDRYDAIFQLKTNIIRRIVNNAVSCSNYIVLGFNDVIRALQTCMTH